MIQARARRWRLACDRSIFCQTTMSSILPNLHLQAFWALSLSDVYTIKPLMTKNPALNNFKSSRAVHKRRQRTTNWLWAFTARQNKNRGYANHLSRKVPGADIANTTSQAASSGIRRRRMRSVSILVKGKDVSHHSMPTCHPFLETRKHKGRAYGTELAPREETSNLLKRRLSLRRNQQLSLRRPW